ncbi:hypothetical protein EST38_g9100 [Candolleomyces aberdarensis]|uniref:Uncharacterized protein n=1 Tax=Candolleomyces aberdarensis TaxID=2316362 RepID=A0A4Q2DE21_9AGAR|nr:hypothetical protein EST38_g9100 [Candolleomyces aberdarensis]
MLGCPELWVDVRVAYSNSCKGRRMFKFMAQHAKNQKLSVTYTHINSQNHSIADMDRALLHTLHEESSKVMSLHLSWGRIYYKAAQGGALFANIFRERDFGNLETLHLKHTLVGLQPVLQLKEVFENPPTKLRRLEVTGWKVDLSFGCQLLGGLTHLVLNGGFDGSLSALSLAPRLKTLHIAELSPTRSAPFPPGHVLRFQHLESLALYAYMPTLSSILQVIQIPPNLAHLSLGWLHYRYSNLPNFPRSPDARPGIFFNTWEHGQEGVVQPQHVLVGQFRGHTRLGFVVYGWKTASPSDRFKPRRFECSPPSVTLRFELPLTSAPSLLDWIFPFTDSNDYQHKWSFDEVRVMEVLASVESEGDDCIRKREKHSFGDHFWTTIANAPYLQTLHLDSHFETKLKEIIVALEHSAFTALRSLVFSFVRFETAARRIPFDEFARSIVEYLKLDGRAPLALLGFRHCPETASQDTLEVLKEVAANVVCRENGEWA